MPESVTSARLVDIILDLRCPTVVKSRFVATLGIVISALFVVLCTLPAQATSPDGVVEADSLVCSVRFQLRVPERCRAQGERAELNNLASSGLLPQRPLPLVRLDESLGDLPFYYVQSRRDNGTPLYTSLQDALKGKNPYRVIEPGFVFFSWIERYDQDNAVAYMIVPGVYVRGDGMARLSVPSYKGLAFSRTPSQTFAWVLTRTETSREPGINQPKTGRTLERFQMVYVLESRDVDGWVWYRIGPDEWIEQRRIAKVIPDGNRPEGVESDRWISIDLYEQTLTVYEQGQMVYATLISTGLDGWWTQPGVFQIYEKLEADPMAGAFTADRSDYYYLEDVPWILYFDESRAIHGSYWHNGYGYPRSHGCVNMSPFDAHWIFNWAEEGTWVYVYDPSGRTPTDAELYGAGGA